MNETQAKLAEAIAERGPMTTFELFRATGIDRGKMRLHLTQPLFVFVWEAGIRGQVKRWNMAECHQIENKAGRRRLVSLA